MRMALTAPRRGVALRVPVRRMRRFVPAAALAVGAFALGTAASAGDAGAWLSRATAAAQDYNYTGTIVFQHGSRVETSRLYHLRDATGEHEKLQSQDGPAREVIRSQADVRTYYPDSKLLRIEPRSFRNAFPSLSTAQQKALAEFYDFRPGPAARVAGLDAQSWVFEPKDGLRYGHRFWSDASTGLLLKAQIVNERNEVVEQFAFTDVSIGLKLDRELTRPTWNAAPPEWQVLQSVMGESDGQETGWTVGRPPPGFTKIAEGHRVLRGRREPVSHLVYSDGLVAVSVFIEAVGATPRSLGHSQQGGINVYVRPVDDQVVTVLGEVPGATVRQMANSVARR